MEEFQRSLNSAISQAQDSYLGSAVLSSFDKVKSSINLSLSSSTTSNSVPNEIPLPPLLIRPPRRMVSVLTCSKLCAVCFVAGVFAGYSLKKRVRHWAHKFLKRLRDD